MNYERLQDKLAILADAAKYDVSCSSSGSKRDNHNKGLGTANSGICHSYTEDGRCVSLLKMRVLHLKAQSRYAARSIYCRRSG